jgi:ATP-dependent Clp protease adapter protein ClpS
MHVRLMTPGLLSGATFLSTFQRGTPMSQHPLDRSALPPDPDRTRLRTGTQDQTRRRQLPPYKVVLQHDAALDLMFVVRTVMEVTRFCRAEATHKMWEAHHSGRSVLLTTYRERAELYVEQFASKGLTVTVEPA